jgi:DNA-binding XRE family transcriptional regulator
VIRNKIAYWRSIMNEGKGISRAHLARHVGVGRSFITKLEKDKAQPSAKLMFQISQYFGQPIEELFQDDSEKIKQSTLCPKTIPERQSVEASVATVPAKPLCNLPATLPVRPVGLGVNCGQIAGKSSGEGHGAPVAQ